VAIGGRPVGAVAVGQEWRLVAADLADVDPLDLDHVGAGVSEYLGGRRSLLGLGEVEDAYSFEGVGHRSSSLSLMSVRRFGSGRIPATAGRNSRRSITRGGVRMIGVNPICARMSRRRSTPGAISMSSTPSSPRPNTARSVM